MTFDEVMNELESYANEGTKKIFLKHGAPDSMFGVKVQDLKKILKKTKKNHELSLALYASGNSDAMYLAGLMADEKQITKTTLQAWAEEAPWYMISEYTVPWVTSETPFGFDLGIEWIKSDKENVAAAGWSTLASYASIKPDEEIDVAVYDKLLEQVGNEIHDAKNRVRYAMNGFVIAVGSYITALTDKAIVVGEKIGKVNVDMNGTACKVPLATTYIAKVVDKGRVGKKRKTSRC